MASDTMRGLLLLFFLGLGGGIMVVKGDLEKTLPNLLGNNKPVIKRIQTEDGDIFDCVDIYKQPALDHPLLLNHKIQMKPGSYPAGMNSGASSESLGQVGHKCAKCPEGTVPVHRTKKDLAGLKKLSKFGTHHITNRPLLEDMDPTGEHWAKQTANTTRYYGSRARINVYGLPNVTFEKSSGAAIWLSNGLLESNGYNAVSAGWMVHSELYGDSETRLTTYWAIGGDSTTYCFNLDCGGFIQVSSDIALGSKLAPLSSYNGEQYHVTLTVFKDINTKDWWLVYGDDHKPLGYWPKKLFTSLANEATRVDWGGAAYGGTQEPSPPIGSGHLPSEGLKKAAYFHQVQVVDNNNTLINPDICCSVVSEPECYSVSQPDEDPSGMGYNFYYGGPGGCLYQ